MNLEEISNKSFLKKVFENKILLKEQIEQTQGYILYLLEVEKMLPPLNDLLEDLSVYSLNFILKNYELNKEEIRSLRKYFQKSSDNKITNEILSDDEIIEHLLSQEELPKNTKLSLDILNNYSLELIRLYESEDYSNLDQIIVNSLVGKDIEEILDLNENIKNYFFLKIFNANPSYFEDKDYREAFKKNLENQDYKLEDISNYRFQTDEKEFLLKTLKGARTFLSNLSWSEVSQIKGVKSLLTPLDFFQEINIKSLEGVQKADLKKNKDLIHDILLNKFFDDRAFKDIREIVRLGISQENFENLIDRSFLLKFFERHGKKTYGFSISDSSHEEKESLDHIENLIFNEIINEDESFITSIMSYDPLRIVNNIYRDKVTKEISQIEIDSIFMGAYKKIFSSVFKTENYFKDSYSRFDLYLKSLDGVNTQALLSVGNINTLDYLLSTFNTRKSQKDIKLEQSIINKLASKLNKESVKKLTSYYDYKLPLLSYFSNEVISNEDNDFFIFKNKENISQQQYFMAIKASKSLQDNIIKDKTVIETDILISLFREIDNKNIEKFIKSYLKNHRAELLNDNEFVSFILTNDDAKLLFPIEVNSDSQKVILKKIEELHLEKENLKKEINIHDKKFNEYDESKYETDEYKELDSRYQKNSNEEKKLMNLLSNDFLRETISNFIDNKNYIQAIKIIKNNYKSQEMFKEKFKLLSFDELLKAIEITEVREILDEVSIKLNEKYTSSQNTILIELLIPYIKLDKMVNLFSDENLSHIIKPILLKHAPHKIFNESIFRPNNMYSNNKYIKYYSNEEIFEALKLSLDSFKLFTRANQNYSYSYLLKDNYEDDEKGFLSLLELAKNNDLRVYTLLYNNQIYGKFTLNFEGTTDERHAKYAKEKFDFKLVLDGLQLLINDYNEKESSFESEYSFKAVRGLTSIFDRIVWQTYYDKEDNNYVRTNYSTITLEQEEALIELLNKNAQMYLFNTSILGSKNDLATYLAENVNKYNKDLKIEDFIYKSQHLTAENMNLEGANVKVVAKNIEAIIDNYLDNNQKNEIDYLAYLSQQYNFFANEINYSYIPYKKHSLVLEFLKKDTRENGFSSMYNSVPSFGISKKLEICSKKFFLERVLENKALMSQNIKPKSRKI